MDTEAIHDKVCSNCGLSTKAPGVEISGGGLCQYCQLQSGGPITPEQKRFWRQKFFDLIACMPRDGAYDCLVSLSGGKDSTYTLLMLKEDYGLRVLAAVLDQGFISEQARRNIDSVVNKAEVDCLFIKPNFRALRELFAASVTRNLYSPKILERTSAICVSCMSLIRGAMLATAIEKRIPIIGYGWSPGQAYLKSSLLKSNPELVKAVQMPLHQAVRSVVGERLDGYFLQHYHFRNVEHFPTYVHPLAFEKYNEEAIFRRIGEYGWVMPQDIDSTTTNCLLNSFGITKHLERFGFHPYAHEYANLVRQGIMSREEAERRMESRAPDQITAMVMEKLGLAGKNTEPQGGSDRE
ncbi:MAG: adenine nucleotide alpha hydrolase family protein [Candidatus Latescibacterota bacterium]